VYFDGMDDLLARLEREPGNVFVTVGSSAAETFTKLPDYQSRVWLRVLPSLESLRVCLDLGYRPERLVCMQGPFSEALNRAMFQYANARILVTKNSGAAGGFSEKVRAARSLDMLTAVLARPRESGGVSLEEARRKIMELRT
jgi:precorrin-6Y C5,15-methyltransferase (decarboxylating)